MAERHVRLSDAQDLVGQAEVVEQLECPRLHALGARADRKFRFAVDDADWNSASRELAREREPGWAGADHEDPGCR